MSNKNLALKVYRAAKKAETIAITAAVKRQKAALACKSKKQRKVLLLALEQFKLSVVRPLTENRVKLGRGIKNEQR